jgi:hypothetical protein
MTTTMATKYLLPCPCGKKLPLEISQAGQSVTCDCGTTHVVPTMRELRQLEVAEPDAAPRGQRPTWGMGRGISFSVAVVVMIASLTFTAFVLFLYLRLPDVGTVEDEIRASRQAYEELTADQMFQLWQVFRDQGLGPQQTHPSLFFERSANQMWWTMLASGLVGLVSLCVVCVLAISARQRGEMRPARNSRAPR